MCGTPYYREHTGTMAREGEKIRELWTPQSVPHHDMACEPPFNFSWGNINQQILGKVMGEKKLEYKKN
jgi:hypothetical protein